jgi:hypothetical protein
VVRSSAAGRACVEVAVLSLDDFLTRRLVDAAQKNPQIDSVDLRIFCLRVEKRLKKSYTKGERGGSLLRTGEVGPSFWSF